MGAFGGRHSGPKKNTAVLLIKVLINDRYFSTPLVRAVLSCSLCWTGLAHLSLCLCVFSCMCACLCVLDVRDVYFFLYNCVQINQL